MAVFERLLAIELKDQHRVWEEDGGRAGEYLKTAGIVYAAIGTKVWEIGMTHIDRDRAPTWVAAVPVLVERWAQAHAKFKAKRATEHHALLERFGLQP